MMMMPLNYGFKEVPRLFACPGHGQGERNTYIVVTDDMHHGDNQQKEKK